MEIGIDHLGLAVRQDLEQIRYGSTGIGSHRLNRDPVLAEGSTQHGEEVADVFTLHVHDHQAAYHERDDLPDRDEDVREVARLDQVSLYAAERLYDTWNRLDDYY